MQLDFHLTSEKYEMRTILTAHELQCTLDMIIFISSKTLDAKTLF